MAQDTGIKIRIRLKAYDHKVIDQSAKQIIDTAIRTGANVAGPVPLPTRRSTYTVVKSPHVYKTGGETYERRVHKRLIDITLLTELRWPYKGSFYQAMAILAIAKSTLPLIQTRSPGSARGASGRRLHLLS